jgi:hypothetical protein
MKSKNSTRYAEIERAQEASRDARLGSVAQGEYGQSSLAGMSPAELARKVRDNATLPKMHESLANANIAGQLRPKFDAAIDKNFKAARAADDIGQNMRGAAFEHEQQAEKFFPVAGQPRISSRYSPDNEYAAKFSDAAKGAKSFAQQRESEMAFKQWQSDSLAQNGHFPLKADEVTDKLTAVMNAPGNKTNDILQKSLGELRDIIQSAKDKYGVIDSHELYTVRKTQAANTIEKFAKETASNDKRYTAGLVRDVQSAIDDAIEKSGGTGWKESYLKPYADASNKMTGMEIGEKLQTALKSPVGKSERANVFATAKKGAEKEYGDLSSKYGKDGAKAIDSVMDELVREGNYDLLAKAGRQEAGGIVGGTLRDKSHIPNMLKAPVTLAHFVIDRLKGNASEKVLKQLSEDMTDPQKSAALMRAYMAKQAQPKSTMLQELMTRGAVQLPNQ